MPRGPPTFLLFFFNAPATTEIYTLSLHDALPIFVLNDRVVVQAGAGIVADSEPAREFAETEAKAQAVLDRKSTRLNSSHSSISYAVFCLKKKKEKSRHPSYNKNRCRTCEHGTEHA